ncbi:MAG TPA: HlyD family efflux transporter periplasmic adaptor subunit [Bacteroidales bacterium]|nr:HlyD family efflux transporter periplasmic adaptor subunit [Bacteroidales bacterium]HRX98075.1 HlyD family efflux transporter periplasmic adaptor subunit [Bacteroidales bacterium]
MKTNYILIILAVVLSACSSNEDRSDAYGNFEVDDVIISAEANGKLMMLNIQEGQRLNNGKLVAVIDTTDLVLKRKQLKAQKTASASKLTNINSQIDVQEQQKANLTVDKNRVEKMLKDGAATQKQLDDINGNLDLIDKQISSIKTQKSAILAELDAIDAQVDQVNASIEKCQIINPITGVVLDKYAEPGEITAFGKPIYKIANTDEMYLRVYVSGAQLPNIKLGQEVQVLIDKDTETDQSLPGQVSWISETAEFTPKIIQTKEERVNLVYAVKIKVSNDGRLKIGMPGEVNF